MSKRVVIGLSGGVDSSVAAYLLKEQGYDVVGIFMRNWHDDSVTISNECPWLEDSNDAMQVAEKLGIPFQILDLSVEYKQRIVDYMFDAYKKGETPNPDILCNREIKFDLFLDHALQIGADFVATGHYCRKDKIEIGEKKVYRLLAGKDANKDQSYFLCQVNQEQLSKALFPIGELEKSEVRKIAKAQDLVTAEKKDSQGLCFIGKVRLPDFLQQQLAAKKGNIYEVPENNAIFNRNGDLTLQEMVQPFQFHKEEAELVGEHQGAHFFTVGQRKGLAVGGKKEPLFVLATDVKENIIYTGQGDAHPGLYRKGLFIAKEDVHWIRPDLKISAGGEQKVLCRIRYRQKLENANLNMRDEGMYITFEKPQRGVAKGQFAAWYIEDELIGSGVIG